MNANRQIRLIDDGCRRDRVVVEGGGYADDDEDSGDGIDMDEATIRRQEGSLAGFTVSCWPKGGVKSL
jgi:hypothetical protein